MPAPASSRSRAIPGSKGEPPMSSVQTALLGRTTAASAADVESLALYRIALWALLGVTINTLACLLIVREAYPARGRARYLGLVLAASTLFGSLGVALRPTGRLAFLYGGISFYSYPILAALLLPMALVAAARLTGHRSAPLVVIAIALAVGMIGAWIARVGFDIIQPVSFIQEEIAKDPTSPIAVAHAIAQKNRTTPGGAGQGLAPPGQGPTRPISDQRAGTSRDKGKFPPGIDLALQYWHGTLESPVPGPDRRNRGHDGGRPGRRRFSAANRRGRLPIPA